MTKGKLLLIAVILVISVPIVIVGCSSSQNNTTETDEAKTQNAEEPLPGNSDTPGDNADLADSEVDIVNFAFSPKEFIIPSGTTVIWRNSDSVPHTVTSDDGFFDSGTILGGGTFSFTFDKVGRYSYFCTLHPYMKATIIVE